MMRSRACPTTDTNPSLSLSLSLPPPVSHSLALSPSLSASLSLPLSLSPSLSLSLAEWHRVAVEGGEAGGKAFDDEVARVPHHRHEPLPHLPDDAFVLLRACSVQCVLFTVFTVDRGTSLIRNDAPLGP